MVVNKSSFKQIANAQISDKRQAIISKLDDGSFTIGQRLEINEGNKVMNIFLKGALHVNDIDCIRNLRDALNLVLDKEE